MSLIANPQWYGAGHQAKFYIEGTMIGSYIGPAELPGYEINENAQAVEGIGSYRDIEETPGRHEPSLSGVVRISDPAPLKTNLLVRNSITGVLQSFTCSIVTPQHTQVFHECYFQEFRLQYQENGDVTANFQIQALYASAPSVGNATPVAQTSAVLRWQHLDFLSFDEGGNLLQYLRSVNIGITNNILRDGFRPDSDASYPRAAWILIPGMEKLQVSYQFRTPMGAAATFNLSKGQSVLTATNPTALLTLTIANNHLSRRGGQQAGANAVLTYTADMASYGLIIS